MSMLTDALRRITTVDPRGRKGRPMFTTVKPEQSEAERKRLVRAAAIKRLRRQMRNLRNAGHSVPAELSAKLEELTA